MRIVVDAPSLPHSEAKHLVRTTQHALDDLNEFPAYHLRLTLGQSQGENGALRLEEEDEASSSDQESALTVKLVPGEGSQALKLELQPHSSILEVVYAVNHIPSVSSSSSTLASSIANKLQELFLEEQASIANLLAASPGSHLGSFPTAPLASSIASSSSGGVGRDLSSGPANVATSDFPSKLARRNTRAFKYASTYHITISLFTPSASPSSWEIEEAIEETLRPLLETFTISNFTVDTQVQLYASLSPSVWPPEKDAARNVWTIRDEDLGAFINAAEWPLAPSIGDGPTLNFILYVPDKANTPLVVKSSRASSWLIPQWGGIAILNPETGHDYKQTLTKDAIKPALLTFSHQLLSLLGAPDSPPSLPLQLNSLTRFQAASLLISASSTMGSLARLTVALPSIPIPKNVALGVDSILSHLHETCSSLREGRFKEALDHAKIAEAESERAFFEKSMVGQVYFPDEHKVAVYLPLLGPVGVPLIISLFKDVKRLRKG